MSEKLKVSGGTPPPPRPPCQHRQGGEIKPVQIGTHTVWAGGGMYFSAKETAGFDLLVNLRAETLPKGLTFGQQDGNILYLPIADYSTIPGWDIVMFGKRMLHVGRQMKAEKRVVIYCAGGHGRTGLVLCWLLMQFEPMTQDPVTEIRRRYCDHAVETEEQRAQVARWSKAKAFHTAMNSEGETT